MYHRINELVDLFAGYTNAYGIYKITGEKKGDKIIGGAATVKGAVTIELWEAHLSGAQGLGIIPINEESKVKFAAIDVDEYKMNLGELNQKVYSNQLPLVTCRTKSGGAHLYLFLTEFTDAAVVVGKMRDFAAILGLGGCEIFPKQTKIIPERGDIGQWINIPYFLAGKTQRWGLDRHGAQLKLDEFVTYALERRVDPKSLLTVGTVVEALKGGPPCLQHLVRSGFPDGTRNQGLFSLGVYARKAYPDTWQQVVEAYNLKFMTPPLGMVEVIGIIRSLTKKDFFYMCEQPPIKNYCNKDICRTCEFGVGKMTIGMPKFGSLTKINTNPPLWFLEVEGGGRLELTTDDLQNSAKFQNRCMATLNIMPPVVKREVWTTVVQSLLEDVTILEIPFEGTPLGQLMIHLEEFCTSKVAAKVRDEIILGKPFTEDGKHIFRLKDFLDYLERQKFRHFQLHHVVMHLQEIGAKKVFFNIRGKGVNAYSIREFIHKQDQPFDPVKVSKETPY